MAKIVQVLFNQIVTDLISCVFPCFKLSILIRAHKMQIHLYPQ